MSTQPVIDSFTYWLYTFVFVKYKLEEDLLVVSIIDFNNVTKEYITTKDELLDIVKRAHFYKDEEYLISRLCASNAENSRKIKSVYIEAFLKDNMSHCTA
jgi:hypothetical protein